MREEDEEETEWEKNNRERDEERKTNRGRLEDSGKNRCVDLIWKNILGAICYAPADIPFESCYQVKHFKSKKWDRDKGLNRVEIYGRWGESQSPSAAAVTLHHPPDDALGFFSLAKQQHTQDSLSCVSLKHTHIHTHTPVYTVSLFNLDISRRSYAMELLSHVIFSSRFSFGIADAFLKLFSSSSS